MRERLRLSLKLGAAYDLGLGLLILMAGGRILGSWGESPDPFLMRLAALPLLILPVLYWTAARTREIDDFKIPVLWARGFGGVCILVLALVFTPPHMTLYIAIGLLDGLWWGIHRLLWRVP